jgi:biopolymer transport protein ExbB/TolQ/ElaB/YqjD/DUF883 family membrane-anchored ribosome-binding protein
MNFSDPKIIISGFVLAILVLWLVLGYISASSGRKTMNSEDEFLQKLKGGGSLEGVTFEERIESLHKRVGRNVTGRFLISAANRLRFEGPSYATSAVVENYRDFHLASALAIRHLWSNALYIGLIGTVVGLAFAVGNLDSLVRTVDSAEIKNKILEVVSSFGNSFYATIIGLVATLWASAIFHSYSDKVDSLCERLDEAIVDFLAPQFCQGAITLEIAKEAAQASASTFAEKSIEPVIKEIGRVSGQHMDHLKDSANHLLKVINEQISAHDVAIKSLAEFETSAKEISRITSQQLTAILKQLGSVTLSLGEVAPSILQATTSIKESIQGFEVHASTAKSLSDQSAKAIEAVSTTFSQTKLLGEDLGNLVSKLDNWSQAVERENDKAIQEVVKAGQTSIDGLTNELKGVIVEGQSQQDKISQAIKGLEPSLVGVVGRIGDQSNASIHSAFEGMAAEIRTMKASIESRDRVVEEIGRNISTWEAIVREYPASISTRYAALSVETANQMVEKVGTQSEDHLKKIDESINRAHDQVEALEKRQMQLLQASEKFLRDFPNELRDSANSGVDAVSQDLQKIRDEIQSVVEYLRRPILTRGRFK